MEAEPDGSGITRALGRLLPREGCHAGLLQYQGGSLVGRTRRQQEAGAPQLHRSYSEPVSVQEVQAEEAQTVPASSRPNLQTTSHDPPEFHTRDLLRKGHRRVKMVRRMLLVALVAIAVIAPP